MDFPKLTDQVANKLRAGSSVRCKLPGHGRLYIERSLPFIAVYQRPMARRDPGSDTLISGGPSYLVSRSIKGGGVDGGIDQLLECISGVLAERWGGCLVSELRTDPSLCGAGHPAPGEAARVVLSASSDTLSPVLKRLKAAMQTADGLEVPLKVEIRPSPPAEANASLYRLLIELEPIHYEPATGTRYPLLLRRLRYHIHWSLQTAAHEFCKQFTRFPAKSPNFLARGALVPLEQEIDRKIVDIRRSFDFLLDVTPTNSHQAWAEFRDSHYQKLPRFFYRHLTIDPTGLKRRLYNIHFHRVEDPDLGELFREQREELAQKLRMLEQRDSPKFLYGSLQLYGDADDNLMQLAQGLLAAIPSGVSRRRKRFLTAQEFARHVEQEIEHYRSIDPNINARVEVRDDISGVLVAHDTVYIESYMRVGEDRVQGLLQHEVGTHLVTYFNGCLQPLQQLATGLASYEELQEALAVLAEYLVGELHPARLRLLAGRVIAVRSLTNGANFIDAFRELTLRWGFSERSAFTIAMRVFRSGGLTKDVIYLRGLVQLLERLRAGDGVEELYVGKIAPAHVGLMRQLSERGVIRPIPLIPRYLREERAQQRLELVRNGVSILDLVERPQL